MPLYEYECTKCGHRFEVIRKFSDPHEKKCPICKGAVRKLLSAPAIQFKGTGWYITDYSRRGGRDPSSSSKDSKGKPADIGGKTAATADKAGDSGGKTGDSGGKTGDTTDKTGDTTGKPADAAKSASKDKKKST